MNEQMKKNNLFGFSNKQLLYVLVRLFVMVLISLFIISCSPQETEVIDTPETPLPYNSPHLTLGLPTDNDPMDDYIIVRYQYALSYNKDLNISNWVSWELNASWYGDVPRHSGNFLQDPLLPDGYYRVRHADYTNSGFDRGHMVRSEERTATEEDNRSTFYMTNILPQTPDLNQGVWLNLEYHLEDLCKKENKELFVIAGGIFHTSQKINDIVAIPDSCFKIVVVLNRGQTLKDINEQTQIIAVVMPNISGVRRDSWETYRTTINRIESSTGYSFLSRVDKKVGDVLKRK
jgi:endonuclease G